MATKVAEIVVDVNAETTKAVGNLRSLDSKVKESSSEADRHTGLIGGAFGKLTAPIGVAGNAVGGFVNTLGKVGIAAAGFGILAGGAAAASGALVSGNAQFETYNVQFATLIKNSDDFKAKYKNVTDPLQLQAAATQEAEDRMKSLAQFGATTPFDLPGVVEANRTLQGFGLQADNTTKRFGFNKDQIMTITGDLAAGTGTSFAEMATNIGKFSSGATGDAISRFQELGVVTRTELTNMGLQFDKGGALIVKNQEDMDKATGVLLSAIKNKYGGLMDAQSATFDGMMSNFGDWIDGTIRAATKPLFEPIKNSLKGLMEFLNTNNDAIVAGLQKVVGGIATIIGGGLTFIISNIQEIFDTARDSVLTFVSAFNGNWKDAETIRPLHRVIGDVATVLGQLWDKFQPVISAVWTLHEAFNPLAVAFNFVKDLISGDLGAAFDGLGDRVIAVGDIFGVDLTEPVNTVINFLMGTAIPALVSFGQTFINDILPAIITFGEQFLAVAIPALQGFTDFIVTNVIPVLGQIGEFIFSTVLPAVMQFADWLGGQLAPIFATIGDTVTNTIIPALAQFGEFIGSTVLPKLQEIGEYIGSTVIPFLQKLAETFFSAMNMIIPAIGTVVDVILNNMIPVLVQWWSVIATVLKPVIDVLINVITNVLLPAFSGIVSFVTSTLVPAFQKIFEVLSTVIIPIFQNVINFITGTLIPNFQNLASNVSTVWNNIVGFIENAWNTISGIFNSIINFITGTLLPAWDNYWQGVSKAWNDIVNAIGNAWNTISGTFNTIISFIGGTLTNAWNTLSTTIGTVWTTITTAIGNAWNTIQDTFNNVVTFIGNTLSDAFTTFQTTVGDVWDNIMSGIGQFINDVKNKFNDVINFFHDLPGNIVNAIGNLGNTLFNAGQSLIQGLINGIKNIHIPLPHVSVSFSDTNFGPITVPIPSFSVGWYAKGGIFDSPSIIGVGDAPSPEAVVPIDKLQGYIKDAINSTTNTNIQRFEFSLSIDSNETNFSDDRMLELLEVAVENVLQNNGQNINSKRLVYR